MNRRIIKGLVFGGLLAAFVGLIGLAAGAGGCGSSSSSGGTTGGGTTGGGGGGTNSTDAAANAALIEAFVAQGNVSGTWTNNTFHSTGDFTVESSFDAPTKKLTITIDVNGNVFGGSDPAPESFVIDMSDFIAGGTQVITQHSDVYGDVTVTLNFLTDNTGTFVATASNVPNTSVTEAKMNGSFSISGSTVSFSQDSASFKFSGTPVTVTSTFH